jgi:hypothetical protein
VWVCVRALFFFFFFFFFFYLLLFLLCFFGSGLAPLAAQRAVDAGTEQQGRPPLRRAMAWP